STVFAVAPGYAPSSGTFDEKQDDPKQLTIKLGPEGRIAGTVVDEAGKGLAGAKVWAIPVTPGSSMSHSAIPADAVLTNADGAFQIGSLAAGNHSLQAQHPSKLLSAPQCVEVETGKTQQGLTIRMRSGLVLAG